ncbi:MAG TPA: L-threonylcarbamoyladenylate synthase [Flavitalea sp.]|nr:L-threonylcarbamoyladenylate synthase [Flavitalea sp.]
MMSEFEKDIEHCLSVLNEGGTILYPTDTVWGIGCDATNNEAVQKVYKIKERPSKKSMIVLLADEKDILKYVANPDPHIFEYLKTVQKPTTIVYDGAIGLASDLIPDDGSIAIRIVHEKFCRHLLKRFRKPIVSTSANLSGEITPGIFREILNPIRTAVDYVVYHRQNEDKHAESSAVVKLNRDGTINTIRE